MQGLTLFGDKPPKCIMPGSLSLQCSPISLKKFLLSSQLLGSQGLCSALRCRTLSGSEQHHQHCDHQNLHLQHPDHPNQHHLPRHHPNQHHHEKPRASPAPTGQSVSIHRNGFAHQGKPRTLYKAAETKEIDRVNI